MRSKLSRTLCAVAWVVLCVLAGGWWFIGRGAAEQGEARKSRAAKFRPALERSTEAGAGVVGKKTPPIPGYSLEESGVYVIRKNIRKPLSLSKRLPLLHVVPQGSPPDIANPEVVDAVRRVLTEDSCSRTALEWLAVTTHLARPGAGNTPVDAWLHSGSAAEQEEKKKLWAPVQLTIHFEQQMEEAWKNDPDCKDLAGAMLYAHNWKATRADDGTAIVTYGSSSDPTIPAFSPDHPGGVVSSQDFKRTEFLLTPEQVAIPIPQDVIDDEWDRGRSAFMRECSAWHLRQLPQSGSLAPFLVSKSDDIAAALAEPGEE